MNRALRYDRNLWLMLLLIAAGVYFAVANYFGRYELHFPVGPLEFHHWLSWVATGFIAVYTPLFYALKRRPHPSHSRYRVLVAMHTYGGIVAFGLISVHFTGQISRPAQFAPQPGTGIVLYPAIFGLLVTGFVQRFRQGGKSRGAWRFVHNSLMVSFYLIIVAHILRGQGIL